MVGGSLDRPTYIETTRSCSRCGAELGRIINRGAPCRSCRLRVCKGCREFSTRTTDWVCVVCHKQMWVHQKPNQTKLKWSFLQKFPQDNIVSHFLPRIIHTVVASGFSFLDKWFSSFIVRSVPRFAVLSVATLCSVPEPSPMTLVNSVLRGLTVCHGLNVFW